MKRILSYTCIATFCAFFSTSSLAAICGPYVGFGAGKSWVKTPATDLFIVPAGGNSTYTLSGTGYRGFFGWNINKYFGLEGGYSKYARALYDAHVPGGVYSSLTYWMHTYDGEAKVYLPIGNSGFNIYALGGIVRVVEIINYNNPTLLTNGKIAPPNFGTTHGYNNRPLYGFGANYNFGRHFTLNAEVTQIQNLNSFGSTPTAVPYMNLASLNLAYNFG
jgi:hypothetical protein